MARSGFVLVTLRVRRKENEWIGDCPELGTATSADTQEEALESLKELILLQLATLTEVGEVWRFLKENKVRCYKKRPRRIVVEAPPMIDDEVFSDERLVPVPC